MFGVYWKRYSHPLNLIMLGLFTLLESITVGRSVSLAAPPSALVVRLRLSIGC